MAQKLLQQSTPLAAEHGKHIFIYGHRRTNQVVYSFTRTLNDTKALAQFPYLGKQTVPSSIRKDFWRPLATVTFPTPHQGILAYQALREFRKRHELEWDPLQFKGLSKKQRGRKLRDQKANTVADLAAVLTRQEELAAQSAQEAAVRKGEEDAIRARLDEVLRLKKEARIELGKMAEGQRDEAVMARYKALKNEKMKLVRQLAAREAGVVKPRAPWESKAKQKPVFSMDGVKVQWADLLDAEFATTWPQSVVHDVLGHGGNRGRYLAPSVVKKSGSIEEGELVDEQVNMVESSQPQEVPATSTLDRIVRRLQFGAKGAV